MQLSWLAVLVVVTALAVPARAEPAGTADSAGRRFALGVSSPTGWLRRSFGASVYIGTGAHHAVRANFARYDAEELLPLLVAGFERYPRTGDIVDLGLGWVWYSRGLWDGAMFEAGALRRERDVRVHPDTGGNDKDTTRSVTYAGRVTVGWSWLFARRVFIAVAAGVSVGYESGHETSESDFKMPVTTSIDRFRVDPEVYLRFGLAFR